MSIIQTENKDNMVIDAGEYLQLKKEEGEDMIDDIPRLNSTEDAGTMDPKKTIPFWVQQDIIKLSM